MRKAPLLVLLLATACASSPTAVMDERVLECAPGADISVQVGLDLPNARLETRDDSLKVLVEVSNNSDDEITVKDIGVEQVTNEADVYRVDSGRRTFNVAVAEGDDHVFELPLLGRTLPRAFSNPSSIGGEVSLRVVTTLSNGDSYRCYFSVRAPL
jgi:hypothetical protein